MTTTHTCTTCGFEADVLDATNAPKCRIHQGSGPRTTLYEVRTDFPDVVGYLAGGAR